MLMSLDFLLPPSERQTSVDSRFGDQEETLPELHGGSRRARDAPRLPCQCLGSILSLQGLIDHLSGGGQESQVLLQACNPVRRYPRVDADSPRIECGQRKAQQASCTQTNRQVEQRLHEPARNHRSMRRVLGPAAGRHGRSTSALSRGKSECGWTEMGCRQRHGQPRVATSRWVCEATWTCRHVHARQRHLEQHCLGMSLPPALQDLSMLPRPGRE